MHMQYLSLCQFPHLSHCHYYSYLASLFSFSITPSSQFFAKLPTSLYTIITLSIQSSIPAMQRVWPVNHPAKMAPKLLTLLSILLFSIVLSSAFKPESEPLLRFKTSLKNTAALSSWNASTPPCSGKVANWEGVLCIKDRVWGLQLEDMGLSGPIDVASLKDLHYLRAINFMNNSFEGKLPNLKMLRGLRSIYLSFNKFSGEILEDAFDEMLSLKKIYLANNNLSGGISLSFTKLPKLVELGLEGNQLSGKIPDFPTGSLKLLNVSNNNLSGQIPANFSTMNAHAFSGNKELCGAPLEPCQSDEKPPPTPPPTTLPTPTAKPKPKPNSNPKPSAKVIIIIVVSIVVILVVICIIVFLVLRQRRKTEQASSSSLTPQRHEKSKTGDLIMMEHNKRRDDQTSSLGNKNNKKGDANYNGRLTFIRDDREQFELTDLLSASAEVLGSGHFGSSYKAAIMNGQVLVVKRFRQMNNMGREEFEEHITRVGRLSHPNLLPLVAFYYRKEEKLLVNDFVDNVSLAVHLHGNRNRGHPKLDWSTRLKIIKGVGKGLVHLYKELPSLIVAHGHLKSSNVLLRKDTFDPILTDYGLVPLVDQEHAQNILVAYKSPEYKNYHRVAKKTDVWSFGLLILEMLTGILPANHFHLGKENDTDLVTLVNAIIQEDKKDELFDKDMGGTGNARGEIMKMLKIALDCVEVEVEKRLDLKEAIEKIEEVNDKDIAHKEV